jgi:hypothetical protein
MFLKIKIINNISPLLSRGCLFLCCCVVINFYLRERDEGGIRILLGDNTGGGAVMLRPIKFRCVGIWISTGLPYVCVCVCVYIYIYLYIYIYIYTYV